MGAEQSGGSNGGLILLLEHRQQTIELCYDPQSVTH